MKKIVLFLAVSAGIFNLSGQITITRQHVVVPGQKILQGFDTARRAISSGGANVTWDYSGLKANQLDSARFGVASWYEGHENFPGANMTLVDYEEENYINFLEVSETEFIVHGGMEISDTGNVYNTFKLKLLGFPSTYQSSYTSSYPLEGLTVPVGMDPDSTGPLPMIDSVRITLNLTSKSIIDGWGTLKLPTGNHSALRQTVSMITAPSVKMYSNGNGFDLPASMLEMFQDQIPSSDTSYNVNFWTNDAKYGFPLVSYTYSPGETSSDGTDFLTSEARASSIGTVHTSFVSIFPNPASNLVHISSEKTFSGVNIIDISGKAVLQQSGTSAVDVKNLSKGVYFIQLLDEQGAVVYGEKLLIN